MSDWLPNGVTWVMVLGFIAMPVARVLAMRRQQEGLEPFPVLVVRSGEAWVRLLDHADQAPPPPAGASYLIPPGRVRSLERYLREHDTAHPKSSWVLRSSPAGTGRQRIQLFLMGDGYWGGVYEATSTTVRPLYRKMAGPGLAFVFGPAALLMNCAAWGTIRGAVRIYKRRRTGRPTRG